MKLLEARVVQAKPMQDETDFRRYVYRVQDVSGLFERLRPTLSELEDWEKDEIQQLLDEGHLETAQEGLDLFWPQTEPEFASPVLCAIYLTPFGVCLDVMGDDSDMQTRKRFEGFLEPTDSLESVTFVPEDIAAFRMMSAEFDDHDPDDDEDEYIEEEDVEAQDLIYEAWESDDRDTRISLAKEALKLDENCIDAISLLADEETNFQRALELRKKAVAIGEKGLDRFLNEKTKGNLWGWVEARPYLRARLALARALEQSGSCTAARLHYEELLRLNESDNQGVRYYLLNAYLGDKKLEQAEPLLGQFDDPSAWWQYGRALFFFLKEGGSSSQALDSLREALAVNPFVARMLLGQLKAPKKLPASYSIGDKDEATLYCHDSSPLWHLVPGSLDWLLAHNPKGKNKGS